MEWVLAAAAASAGSLFSYNRENFFFDKELQLKQEYQGQEMKVRQFELYREDVRDLVGLTVRKMENYLIVNTLQLGFCFTLFTEGRPKPGTPQWLVCLYAICNSGAFMYYLLSMWLAMHASISAHAFGVRLLTQFVRLPVPGATQLDMARALSQDYEGMNLQAIFRIPLWKQQLNRFNATMTGTADEAWDTASVVSDSGDASSNVGEPSGNSVGSLQHVRLYRQLQANWQSYDAYARVCMAMGTNQLLHALSYCCLGLLITENDVPFPAFCCVVIFTTCGWVLARLDLYLSRRILATAAALLVAPPVLTTVNLAFGRSSVCKEVVPAIFLLHVVWIIFTLCVAKADNFGRVALPTKFRSVLFLDVFGWLTEEEEDQGHGGLQGGSADLEQAPPRDLSPVYEVEREGEQLPPSLRCLLVSGCRDLQREIDQDLLRWEAQEAAALLREDVDRQRQLQRMRFRFDATVLELAGQLKPNQEVEAAPGDAGEAPAAAEPAAWLRLEWNPHGGTPMEYYYRCDTGDIVWETPEGPARISDLDVLERSICKFSEQAAALLRATPAADETPPSSRARTTPLPPVADGRAAVVGQSNEQAGNSQEQLPSSGFLGPTPAPSSTAVPAPATTPLPGRLPWATVLRGSLVLILVWLIAAAWMSLSLISGWTFPFAVPVHDGWLSLQESLGGEQEVLPLPPPVQVTLEGSWPHPFLRPVGLACHSGLGPSALLAEAFTVHEVALGPQGLRPRADTGLAAAVAGCLSRAPAFHGRGLASISLECPEVLAATSGSNCSAVLLGADGLSALRCPLGSRAGEGAVRLRLLGGPWRALAPDSSRGQYWALGEAGALVRLQLRAGVAAELLPDLDLAEGAADGLVQLQVLGGRLLAGLGPQGRLRAWQLQDGTLRSWGLRVPPGVRWVASCMAGERLFLAGVAVRDNRMAGVWSLSLPPELRTMASGEPGGAFAARH
mmetsp:Transcript_34076/g.105983  ORF Transcript_34076/g.105983 Transcript_34076/m.105983 type:complete len:958 (-) Transcript_34076:37-2910(-)